MAVVLTFAITGLRNKLYSSILFFSVIVYANSVKENNNAVSWHSLQHAAVKADKHVSTWRSNNTHRHVNKQNTEQCGVMSILRMPCTS